MLPTSDEFKTMTPMGLHTAAVAVRRTEGRLSKLLGFHLGTLLHKDLLAQMFLQNSTPEWSEDEEREPQPGDSTAQESYVPLVLGINPKIRDVLRKRAIEMSPLSESTASEPSIPGLDPDQALFEQLQAAARAADARKKKLAQDETEGRNLEADRIMGIRGHIKV